MPAMSSMSPSRAWRSKPSKSGAPMAACVPRLIHTGMRKRKASCCTQPAWSACSWVMNTAASPPGSTPACCRRAVRRRRGMPQSMSRLRRRRPSPDSTRVALPALPLPKLLKRRLIAEYLRAKNSRPKRIGRLVQNDSASRLQVRRRSSASSLRMRALSSALAACPPSVSTRTNVPVLWPCRLTR